MAEYLEPSKKQEIFAKYGKSNQDTGSPESQVALFSYRIAHLTEHVKKNKKDVVTRRSLLRLVGKRRQILDYLQENGSIGIKEIRGLLGIKKGQADALVTRLMMQCRVITGDIIRVYRGEDLHYNGWQTSSFCTPEALFDTGTPFAGFPGFPFQEDAGLDVKHSPEESYRLLQQKIRSLVPEATDKQIAKLLS